MKSFWISEVVLLLSVIELEATSISEFCCPKRNLTVTVDDILRLYIDGIEITGLPNAEDYGIPDVVDLPCTTRLIAIHGRNKPGFEIAGILASTDDDYVLTNSSWKCSNISHSGWEGIDFDDSTWMSAVAFSHNGDNKGSFQFVHGISSNAFWIWLRQWKGLSYEEVDEAVYCRKRLGYDCCCYNDYANDGSKRCKASSKGNDSTSLAILGFFFGVSVLVIIALISALWLLHLRKKTVKYEGMIDEVVGQSGVDNQIPQNDIDPGQSGVNDHISIHQKSADNAVGDEQVNEADYEYLT